MHVICLNTTLGLPFSDVQEEGLSALDQDVVFKIFYGAGFIDPLLAPVMLFVMRW